MIAIHNITGLVLAGGLGSRMGGVDKGLVEYQGDTLAQHALKRLAPQVGSVAINANRNRSAYEAMGVPVWADAVAGRAEVFAEPFPGPLAGMLAGLDHCSTPFLVTVPCDCPRFPLDLVARLADALARADAELAMAATCGTAAGGRQQMQPVFCLMRVELKDSVARFLSRGQRKIDAWGALQRRVAVRFDEPQAFANANTADELQRLAAS